LEFGNGEVSGGGVLIRVLRVEIKILDGRFDKLVLLSFEGMEIEDRE
jgi:hypothetical protein